MSNQLNFCGCDFDCMEAYDASVLNCYAFRRGSDTVDGNSLALGNMVSGFPFDIEGVLFRNSEAAYIAGMFSEDMDRHLELQEALIANDNGFMAKKRIAKPHKAMKRADWLEFNVQWMLYVVWCKVVSNASFRQLLMALPSDAVIIEDSTFQTGTTADFWGTKNKVQRQLTREYKHELFAKGLGKVAIKTACDNKRLGEWRRQGVFEGRNVMGKILMVCRDALFNGDVPQMDAKLLRNKHINLCGKVLDFSNIPSVEDSYHIAC